ncbi:MAG: hypothetical protein KatS3mg068_0980 [Candidatus Sericytochromatia bacterium]|nr:MAG: hypothetical protein KatS3mg068_0980 [Candidatus Sericytochromatia bacterium]
MLSKCPECGKSYPSHHGKICKVCASKKNTTAQVENKPITNQEVKKVEEKSIEKVENKTKEKTFKTKICLHCQYENVPTDVFCVSCKKMLVISGNQKIQDYPLSNIKNVIPDHVNKLKKIGIDSTLKLLDKGCTPIKRKTLLIKTGISESLLMRLINISDLLRIDTLEPENAFLLENIGINSIKLLEKKTTPELLSLINKNKDLLKAKNIFVLPSENQINKWIEEAKSIEKLVS